MTRSDLDDAFGLARVAATAWWRTAEWTAIAPLRAGRRALRALSGESPRTLFEETGAEVRDYALQLLRLAGAEGADPGRAPGQREDAVADPRAELRERGAELLRQSADVRFEEDSHPAYLRILEVLSPDEARILRLLALSGAQPAVDIRAGLPLVSDLVAPGRTMIGAEAGCRYPDRIHSYLNNLNRLGLTWFSRETIRDPGRYQVLEAQPDVIAAMRKGGRTARTVRRSILLTPFGRDFCDACLPLDTIEIEALQGPTASDGAGENGAAASGEDPGEGEAAPEPPSAASAESPAV